MDSAAKKSAISELNGFNMAASRALRIPEIAAMIIVELADDKTTLVTCAQVCSLWAAEATCLLWQNANLPSALLDHMGSDRIQFYAGKICSLDLVLDSSWRKFLSEVKFPRLSRIRITEVHHQRPLPWRSTTRITEIQGKGLTNREDASLVHPVVTRASLKSLKSRYPTIRKLSEHGYVPTGTDAALLSFLDDIPEIRLPELREVILSLRSRHTATEALFCGLAVSSSVTELEFPELDASFVRSAEAITPHPFRHLRYLMCSGDAEALINLMPHLHALEIVNLITWGDPPDLLLHIAQLTNLQELIVRQVCLPDYESPQFYTDHILAIGRRCKKLIRLHLEDPVNDQSPLVVCHIDDNELDQLLSTMPQLQHLCLKSLQRSMSLDIFGIIGRRCRDLRSLSIGGDWDLPVVCVSEVDCLFPQLRFLEVDRIEIQWCYDSLPEYEYSPKQFVEALQQHAPRLEELSCYPGVTVCECKEVWPPGGSPFVERVQLAHRNANLAAFLPRAMAPHCYYYDVVI
ncbi:hypothetical protein MMC30_002121 [Trapelia coarctata]|nr:hypothetical protein [Trapelia coarctata]